MKLRNTLLLALFLLIGQSMLGQDAEKKKVDKPVRSPWEATTLIDFPTTRNLPRGGLEMMINHRFGKMGNGFSDLFGVYAPSNICIGMSYGITSKLSVGLFTEKNNKMQQLEWKYSILRQTRSGAVPVDLSYYGNIAADTRDEEVYGVNYEAMNRFSFFNELIVSRKFGAKLTVQTALSYTHFNAVDSLERHDILAWHAGARYKVMSGMTLIMETNMPLNVNLNGNERFDEFEELNPGAAFGLEFGTSTHAFQIFVSNYEQIIRQKNIAYNPNSLSDDKPLIGFNVTVRF